VTASVREACPDYAGVSFERITDDVAGSTDNYRVMYPAYQK